MYHILFISSTPFKFIGPDTIILCPRNVYKNIQTKKFYTLGTYFRLDFPH